ncbi:hypothetical protein [Paenibacillus popilliae]|uniref:Uncharacterized protein n=1 Tax=Paenibacillus popilliae TaxID=78057 RepID=A0ABY3AV37_PAEPP|nr:hypothetical protein [Paenibacillus sp. SDF0028]TQR46390.1 hypothetical protein C7Y44_01515 [Paenibacillus sp. SDF0028]
MSDTKRTKSTYQNYKSTKTENEWLQDVYSNRKQRTLNLGIKAINSLLSKGEKVSYRTVVEKSKELDDTGKGVHQNTIIRNKELNDYYQKHRSTNQYMDGKYDKSKINLDETKYRNFKIDRDISRLKDRYQKLTKNELIHLLINAEQYISDQNYRWLKSKFEEYQ